MDILNITDNIIKDETIESYQRHLYEPITGTNLNSSGETIINIETQDLFTHPSERF